MKTLKEKEKLLVTSNFSFSFNDFILLTLYLMPILCSSNSVANKNMMSNIWTNGVQLSVRVENIVGRGEIARYELFLFPQCFQKLSVADASK